ncbi:MAG: tetratricopeptide repeat protein, partial [Bryobacterales bacterium]|nr:tetratricopeptide repeat protein [Bryobacterales bacterium]
MRFLLAAFLLIAPAIAQSRFERLNRDLKQAANELRISNLRAAVVESGEVVWQSGALKAPALEEPVIAERVLQMVQRGRISLDDTAPIPPGATIREVLENRADGTPGEEVLENRSFFDALKPIVGNAPLPNVLEFAKREQGTLGWLTQDYQGARVIWSYSQQEKASLLVVRILRDNLTLVASANSSSMVQAARLADGNIARSTIAMAFFKDLATLPESKRDELIDHALIALYFGQRDRSETLARQALDKFPELESTPDVTLLYLFAELRLPATEASATAVIRDHPSLPTAWFYYGQYLEASKRYREAAACFEKITM